MKKLYASLCAVALASMMTMGAKTVDLSNIDLSNPIPISKVLQPEKKATGLKFHLSIDRQAAPSRAEDWQVVGEAYMEDNVFGTGDATVTLEQSTKSPGVYRIPDAWSKASKDAEPFVFDASNPACVIVEDQYTGVTIPSMGSEALIMSFSFFALTNGVTEEEFITDYAKTNITLEDGILYIPTQGILMMFPDSELNDSNGDPIAENIYIGNDNDMVVVFPGAEYTPPFVTLGVGEFRDNFISPFFGYEGEEDNPPYEVTVQIGATEETEGMLCLADAWWPWNISGKMYADISNPDCVIIPLQYFADAEGLGAVYYMSYSYNYVDEEEGLTPEQFIEQYPGKNISMTDGVIYLPPVCMFYYLPDYDKQHIYTNPTEDEGYILLPESGIKDITTDINADATAEYYNMQGIRVANPTPGSLYIKKQGSNVSKIVIR